MTFKCLATGSSGNCYIVRLGEFNILLDAGIPIEKIVKSINLNNVDLCFISHEHKDHSKSLENLRKRRVLILEGKTIQEFTEIKANEKFDGKLKVFCFDVEHGDAKNAAIILKTEKECVLYIIDFTICKYDLSIFKFTSVIVECNYLTEKVKQDSNFTRTKENIYRHQSLEGCMLFLSKLNLSNCERIVLTHFSDNYSEPALMGSLIKTTFGIKTLTCKKYGGYDTYE